MKCSIQGCPGVYTNTTIIHTVCQDDEVSVIENVPAEVCTVCGDTLLKPDTIRHIESLLREKKQPERMIPLFEYE